MERLTFISGNVDKIRQLNHYLGTSVAHKKIDLTEIQSTFLSYVVTQKAKEAFKKINSPVLVEDTALTLKALGDLPGPFIRWFERSLGNEGLCQLLNSFDDRTAIAEVTYGLYDGKSLKLFSGIVKGTIPIHPKGKGFGWDPIFIPEGSTKTRAEMSEEEFDATSMRRLAAEKLAQYLKDLKR